MIRSFLEFILHDSFLLFSDYFRLNVFYLFFFVSCVYCFEWTSSPFVYCLRTF